ncbi:MAG: hypothetical protein HC871_00790 [Rhizobiales bacterium]|nr:hypothetical protein [Hyphomicrobiales bacterium]
MAEARGLAHKALVPVGGVPMVERVVGTLLAVPGIEHVILCTDPALARHGLGEILTGTDR